MNLKFGSDNFNKAVASLSYLNTVMVKDQPVQLTDVRANKIWRGHDMISVCNWYFTLQSQVPHKVLSTFSDEIDLLGILTIFGQQSREPLVNIEENRVIYFQREINNGSVSK